MKGEESGVWSLKIEMFLLLTPDSNKLYSFSF
jgi:hypothetical protein